MDQESDSKSEWSNDFSMKRALLVLQHLPYSQIN